MAEEWTFTGVTLYKQELDHYLNDPTGEVGKYLSKRGKLMLVAAKKQVGKDTGALRASIKMLHTRDSISQSLWIGSSLSYAFMHHEGTKPHIIRPNNHQVLRFSSGGRIIYSRMVMHPGTRPNHYLSDQLAFVRV